MDWVGTRKDISSGNVLIIYKITYNVRRNLDEIINLLILYLYLI